MFGMNVQIVHNVGVSIDDIKDVVWIPRVVEPPGSRSYQALNVV